MLVGRALRGSKLLGEADYKRRLLFLRLYTVVWVALLILVAVGPPHLDGSVRIALLIVLAIGVPSIGDLFRGYRSYHEEWRKFNKPDGGIDPE